MKSRSLPFKIEQEVTVSVPRWVWNYNRTHNAKLGVVCFSVTKKYRIRARWVAAETHIALRKALRKYRK